MKSFLFRFTKQEPVIPRSSYKVSAKNSYFFHFSVFQVKIKRIYVILGLASDFSRNSLTFRLGEKNYTYKYSYTFKIYFIIISSLPKSFLKKIYRLG